MDYAVLDENNIVINVVTLMEEYANEYPGTIVPLNDVRTGIGDEYKNGKFYHNGEVCYSRIGELDAAMAILMMGVEIDE